jgi:hypothetical protein
MTEYIDRINRLSRKYEPYKGNYDDMATHKKENFGPRKKRTRHSIDTYDISMSISLKCPTKNKMIESSIIYINPKNN